MSFGLFTCEAMDLFNHLVEIGENLLWRSVLVGSRRGIRVGVEGKLQPIAVVLPFLPVPVGELREIECIVIPFLRGAVNIQCDLGSYSR